MYVLYDMELTRLAVIYQCCDAFMVKVFWLVVVIACCYTLHLLVSTKVDSTDMNAVLRVQGDDIQCKVCWVKWE